MLIDSIQNIFVNKLETSISIYKSRDLCLLRDGGTICKWRYKDLENWCKSLVNLVDICYIPDLNKKHQGAILFQKNLIKKSF